MYARCKNGSFKDRIQLITKAERGVNIIFFENKYVKHILFLLTNTSAFCVSLNVCNNMIHLIYHVFRTLPSSHTRAYFYSLFFPLAFESYVSVEFGHALAKHGAHLFLWQTVFVNCVYYSFQALNDTNTITKCQGSYTAVLRHFGYHAFYVKHFDGCVSLPEML